MKTIRYYTRDGVQRLRDGVREHLDCYYAPAGPPPLDLPHAIRAAHVDARDFAGTLSPGEPGKPYTTDLENALAVYVALERLSRHQASEERLWTYLCHVECPEYVSRRWLARRPDEPDAAIKRVHNHFFARGNRALIRDNGISRLWWLGYIAHQVDRQHPRRFLEILLHRQDVRSALIERPTVSMNAQVLKRIYAVMRDHWEHDRSLFERDTFRSWMVALNRKGGVLLLDSLPDPALDRLLRKEALQAINSAAST